ncbi:hypothetical protein GCM10020000_60060 [Streptomyces olivoverticillatus]
MRCPICSVFEQNVGETIEKDVKDGKYKVSYHIGTFLDRNPQIAEHRFEERAQRAGRRPERRHRRLPGLQQGALLQGQPPGRDEGRLLRRRRPAEGRPAGPPQLKGNAKFEKDVKDGTFRKWALGMSDSFDQAKDVTGTPPP